MTAVAGSRPKLTVVDPSTNPVPWTRTVVPPMTGPMSGLTDVTVGGAVSAFAALAPTTAREPRTRRRKAERSVDMRATRGRCLRKRRRSAPRSPVLPCLKPRTNFSLEPPPRTFRYAGSPLPRRAAEGNRDRIGASEREGKIGGKASVSADLGVFPVPGVQTTSSERTLDRSFARIGHALIDVWRVRTRIRPTRHPGVVSDSEESSTSGPAGLKAGGHLGGRRPRAELHLEVARGLGYAVGIFRRIPWTAHEEGHDTVTWAQSRGIVQVEPPDRINLRVECTKSQLISGMARTSVEISATPDPAPRSRGNNNALVFLQHPLRTLDHERTTAMSSVQSSECRRPQGVAIDAVTSQRETSAESDLCSGRGVEATVASLAPCPLLQRAPLCSS